MKKILCAILLAITYIPASAKLDTTIVLTPNFITVLIFPYDVSDAVWGSDMVATEKVAMHPNILKVKCKTSFNTATSLHVFTSSKTYLFTLVPGKEAGQLLYDFTSPDSNNPVYQPGITTPNPQYIQRVAGQIASEKPFSKVAVRKNGISLLFQGIFAQDNYMFLKFVIRNRSNLPYQVSFADLYVKDQKVFKRSSDQSIQLVPITAIPLPHVPGNSSLTWIVPVRRITFPDKKRLFVELTESFGGRHLKLGIKNKKILNAKILTNE